MDSKYIINIYKETIVFCLKFILALGAALLFLSCSSHRKITETDYHALAVAGLRLGFDIDFEDNNALMIEAASWLGTPYRLGGNGKSGIDCSGFTSQIARNVYGVKLPRRSTDQCKELMNSSSAPHHQGSLLFFGIKNKRVCDHVGIYLKNNIFVHASSSRGVTTDNITKPYWQRAYMGCYSLGR